MQDPSRVLISPGPLAGLLVFLLSAGGLRAADEVGPLIGSVRSMPLERRVEEVSAHFLGRPYGLGKLGEGPEGRYDQDPRVRFDRFDCTTYVETVMALALTEDSTGFHSLLDRIRYRDGAVSFTTRNHFTSLDWIPNNVKAGYLTDITRSVGGDTYTLEATALIDVGSWYRSLGEGALEVEGLDAQARAERLEELRNEGRAFEPVEVSIPYLPLSVLVDPAHQELVDRIPTASVINIVRPNWDLTEHAGTHLNVSHQGLGIRKEGDLYFRNATSVGPRSVADIPLVDYLRRFRDHPTIRGINVLKVQRPDTDRPEP